MIASKETQPPTAVGKKMRMRAGSKGLPAAFSSSRDAAPVPTGFVLANVRVAWKYTQPLANRPRARLHADDRRTALAADILLSTLPAAISARAAGSFICLFAIGSKD